MAELPQALVVPALLDLLATQLGLDKVVMVPQEMVAGYILARLPPSPIHFEPKRDRQVP